MREEGKLFIGGLSASTDDEMLKEYYSQWGRLIDFIVMKDPVTKRSRGFGFVTYADSACADVAMSCRPHSIDGKAVEAKRATPRESDNNSKPNVVVNKPEKSNPVKRIFLSGIKDEHDETMFTEYFSQFGVVSSVEIVMDKNTGKKRGFGYVTFDTSEAVESAVAMKSHMIGGMRCDSKKALSRDEMNRSSYQYGRDRQQRDYRSRGTGRGETYGFGNGYSGGYGNDYGGGYDRYNSGGYGGNYGQMSGNGAWSTGGYQQKGAAPYYSPDPYARNQDASAYGSLSAPYQTSYGSNGASSGYQQPQSWNADQSQLDLSQANGSWNAAPRQVNNSWGQSSAYPGQQPATQNWSQNSGPTLDGASATWQNGPSAAGMYSA